MRSRILSAVFLLLLGTITPVTASADKVIIFAAASMRDALNEVIKPIKLDTGIDISISYASSGVLARQITQGAPASIYLSANQKWADWLKGKVNITKSQTLLTNQLVLITNILNSQPLYLDGRLSDGLAGSKLVIGDLNHVPAGIYAKQALENMQLWPSISRFIAQTSDVRGVLLLVERGEAVAGVTYKSDAIASSKVRVVDIFSPATHDAIVYEAVLLDDFTSESAYVIFEELLSDKMFDIYEKYGFGIVQN